MSSRFSPCRRTLPPPLREPSILPASDEDIARLVDRGDPARRLPARDACHGANAGGPIETPALSRQSKDYLVAQLHGFKSGTRHNDIYTRMRSVTATLTDREIDARATFYSRSSR